jgi:hypothetical protein
VNRASTRLADLDGARVYVGEAHVGSVRDVFADADAARVVGFEIASPDGRHWFVPWAASSVEPGLIRSTSALTFVAGEQIAFYDRHGLRLLPDESRSLSVDGEGRVLTGAPAGIRPS